MLQIGQLSGALPMVEEFVCHCELGEIEKSAELEVTLLRLDLKM